MSWRKGPMFGRLAVDRDEGCVHAAEEWEPPLPRVTGGEECRSQRLRGCSRLSSCEGLRESVPVASGKDKVVFAVTTEPPSGHSPNGCQPWIAGACVATRRLFWILFI